MRINLFKKYKKHIIPILVLGTVIIFVLTFNHFKKEFFQVFNQTDDECIQYRLRLEALEPEKPIDIDSTPIGDIPQPTKMLPISEVIKKGKEISLEWAYNDPNWIRPSYKTYWHSTEVGGRWSYVPTRMNYALHRIYTTYRTSSIWYDFRNEVGIYDESLSFDFKGKSALENIALVVMQSDVKKILTLGNQVVIVAEPKRNGLQVINIPISKIQPSNVKESIIFQIVTPDGYEIDYSLIYTTIK